MQNREKILAGGFALLIGGWFGWPIVDSWLFEPVRLRQEQRDSLQQEVSDRGDETLRLVRAAKQLGTWKQESLPGDPLDAQRLYQQWLTDLATLSGIERLKVTPEQRAASKSYTAVRVSLVGEGTFDEITTFLDEFHRVGLLHRLTRFTVRSPVAEGTPNMTVDLMAEGVVLDGVSDRASLFPEIKLSADLSAATTELVAPGLVKSARNGDHLQVGTEAMKIVSVQGEKLVLNRGQLETTPTSHVAGQTVQLWPTRAVSDVASAKSAERTDIANLFVKPRQYRPRFEGVRDLALTRGGQTQLVVKVADFNPELGAPQLSLADAPAGASLDAKTGELVWNPPADFPAGRYLAKLNSQVPGQEKPLTQTITFQLTDPNRPPEIDVDRTLKAFIGQTFTSTVLATDPEGRQLTLSLEGAPEGLVLSPSGELSWEVSPLEEPRELTATVVATDDGSPAQTTKREIQILVEEDLSPYVVLVASVADGIDEQIWLYDRTTGTSYVLRSDEPFESAGISGTVRTIQSNAFTFERNGRLWELSLGQPLAEAVELGPAITPPGTIETSNSGTAVQPLEAPRPNSEQL